ncbi:MAG: hypothetical protein AB1846_02085 [Chloroflexota bacterium]
MKSSGFKELFRPFERALADVPWFGPTLSAVLVATVINVLTDTLSTWGGPLYGWLFILLLVIGTVLFVAGYNRRYRHWIRNLGPIAEIASPRPHVGLIALFSRKETLRAALAHHSPVLKQCWLIVTPETQAEAGELMAEFASVSFSILPIPNLYDTQACYNIVKHIYRQGTRDVDISPADTIADITGGTKPMTMGMIVACIEGGFPLEHVPTRFDPAGKPLGPLPPIEMRVQKG